MRLALHILSSGVEQQDDAFLASEWCSFLKAYVGQYYCSSDGHAKASVVYTEDM